jgi:hypothetical protein
MVMDVDGATVFPGDTIVAKHRGHRPAADAGAHVFAEAGTMRIGSSSAADIARIDFCRCSFARSIRATLR